MVCWSACAKLGVAGSPASSVAHQYDATPKLLPPSSERNRSTPPVHTISGSTGSTAITLSYQPWLKKKSEGPNSHSERLAMIGLLSSSVLSLSASVLRSCAFQVVLAPAASERKRA